MMHPVDLVRQEEDSLLRCVLPSRRHEGDWMGEHAEARLVPGNPQEALVPFAYGVHKTADVRQFERTGELLAPEKLEQTAVNALIVVDRMASMAYGEIEQKLQLAEAVVEALVIIHGHQLDAVGEVAFNGEQLIELPAMSGLDHFEDISENAAMPAAPLASEWSLVDAMRTAELHDGPVYIVSDYSEPGIEDVLAELACVNEVTAFRVVAQSDVEVPDVHRLRHVMAPLSGKRTRRRIDFRNREVRNTYDRRVKTRTERLEDMFVSLDIPYVELRTDQDWLGELLEFLSPEQWKVR